MTVDNFSVGSCCDTVGTVDVLEILCLIGRFGISWISCELSTRPDERSGFGSGSIDSDNGNGISGPSSQIAQIEEGEGGFDGRRNGANRRIRHEPVNASSSGI